MGFKQCYQAYDSHTIQPRKAYDSMVFSMFTVVQSITFKCKYFLAAVLQFKLLPAVQEVEILCDFHLFFKHTSLTSVLAVASDLAVGEAINYRVPVRVSSKIDVFLLNQAGTEQFTSSKGAANGIH